MWFEYPECLVTSLCIVLSLSVFVSFGFKQKTAYELRISDWSSDVCSSDLRVQHPLDRRRVLFQHAQQIEAHDVARALPDRVQRQLAVEPRGQPLLDIAVAAEAFHGLSAERRRQLRSEERRVGEEGGSTCRCRGWPSH